MERQQIEKQRAEQRAEARKAGKEKRAAAGATGDTHRDGLRDKKDKDREVKVEDEQVGGKRKRNKANGTAAKGVKKAKVEVSFGICKGARVVTRIALLPPSAYYLQAALTRPRLKMKHQHQHFPSSKNPNKSRMISMSIPKQKQKLATRMSTPMPMQRAKRANNTLSASLNSSLVRH